MNIVCLDMEGVLVPEIWIAFSEASGIPELRRTTRDEPDYDKLMTWRLGILKEHGLGLKEIQDTIAKIDPLPGAKAFLDELRATTQVIILSDTFEEFAKPLMEKLGWPTIFCNSLEVAENGEITGYKMRCEKSKLTTVKALQSMGYETIPAGASHNALAMIRASKAGFLFKSTDQIKNDNPDLPAYETYEELLKTSPKNESFVDTPDGRGTVTEVNLLKQCVRVRLEQQPDTIVCHHNCDICVLRNGKGSREGIAIPERPARYVEPKEAEEFREEAPALMPPFYMDTQLEEAPMREKIGAPGSGDGKPRRRHRGGRRRGGAKSGEGVEQPKAEARGPEKKEGRPRPPKQESRPAQPKPTEARPGENRAAAPDGEGEAKRRRRPHHRGGRRRNKNGGEGGGSAPKSE